MNDVSSLQNHTITKIAGILKSANRVLFVTGAGISADSGLPTYRGIGGLYDGETTEEGVTIEEALSGPMFARQPDLTWKYLWQIGASCVGAEPNEAHRVIALLETAEREVWVLTQNIDGLHRFAGSKNLIEVHGHMFDLICTRCQKEYQASDLLAGFCNPPTLPPCCPDTECNGIVRPQVVLFEEMLPHKVTQGLNQIARLDFDMIFAIGTSAVFPYIQQPFWMAQQLGVPSVEINPVETTLSGICRYRLTLGAAEAMRRIADEI